MSIRKGSKIGQGAEGRAAETEVVGENEAHAPRKLTFAENLIVTIKILAGFGLLGLVLWGIDRWTAAP